jgi:hypothetical protein
LLHHESVGPTLFPVTAEQFYVLRWKRNAPPVDYSVCDAYTGAELYVTSDQADALAQRVQLGKVRHVKLVAVLYGRTFQAMFAGPRRTSLVGWRMLRHPRRAAQQVAS